MASNRITGMRRTNTAISEVEEEYNTNPFAAAFTISRDSKVDIPEIISTSRS
jgi:hypothetical protein